MRIAEFHVEGFGRLANLSMTDIPPGLSIVLGENEAGKTTLLEFLRSILFGLPARKQKEFYPPLNGGRKAGRLVLRNEQSERFIVERCEGKGNGLLTVTMPDGSQGGDAEFRQLIGSATDDLYRNVFAFSLSELQSLESLKTEKVRDAIYSAGIGIGRRTIPQVLQELTKQAEGLFVPGGSKPVMNTLLSRIEDHGRQIKAHEKDQDEYQRIQSELATCEASLRCIGSELSEARRRFERVRILQQAWLDWLTLGDCRDQLATLPLIEAFPVDGIKRLDELVVERRGNRDQNDATISQHASDKAALVAIQVDRVLLGVAKDIRRFDRGLALYEQTRQQHLVTNAERELAEQKLLSLVRDLGGEWNEEKLAVFDLSIPAREDIEACRQSCEAARNIARERQVQWQSAVDEQAEDIRLEKEARQQLEQLPQPSATLDVTGIRKLQLGLQTVESARRDLPGVESRCTTQISHLLDTLRKFGPHWTEDCLRAFDTSLAVHEQVQTHQERLANLRSDQQDADRRARDASDLLDQAELDVARLHEMLTAMPKSDGNDEAELSDRRRSLGLLRSQLTVAEQYQARHAHLNERQQDLDAQALRVQNELKSESLGLPAATAFILVAVGVVGLLSLGLGRSEWLVGIIVCVLFVIVAAVLAFARRTSAARNERQRMARTQELHDLQIRSQEFRKELNGLQAEQGDLDAAISSQAQRLGITGILNALAIDDAERRLEQSLALWQQRRPVEQKLADAQEMLKRSTSASSRSNEAATEKTNLLNAAQKEWQHWLAKAELPESLTPENAANVLNRLDAAREQLKAIDGDRERIQQMQSALRDYVDQLQSVADASRITIPTDAATAVSLLVDRVADQERQAQAVEVAAKVLADAQAKSAQAQLKTENAEGLHRKSLDAERHCQQRWTVLRQRLGLRDSLTVERAPQMLQAIERGRDQLVALNELRKREGESRDCLSEFGDDVRSICRTIGRSEPADADVPNTVSTLSKELDQTEDAQRTLNALQKTIQDHDTRLKVLDHQFKQRQGEIDELLRAAGSTDEETFRRNALVSSRRQTLEDQIQQLGSRLRQLAGSADTLQALQQELAQVTPADLDAERSELETKIDAMDLKENEAAATSGRLKVQLEQLEESDEVSRLRIEQQADRAEFATNAEEWSILKIATHLIERAREKYERERRPGVLKEAERYFARITNFKYTEILAPAGGDQVVVLTPDGSRKEVSQLSRGTAEQLYLSLRFGFVQSFIGRSESLPLVFDDILVNFDADRARATVAAILELSKSLQILFFTCHRTTVDLMQEVDPQIPVFVLRDGHVVPADAINQH